MTTTTSRSRSTVIAIVTTLLMAIGIGAFMLMRPGAGSGGATAAASDGAAAPVRPALSVVVTRPQRSTLPLAVTANGNIAAWQEASIGTEANGLRLASVRVNVGDTVKRGQTLATFDPQTIEVELSQTRAAVAEAEAMYGDAAANAKRAQTLDATGALSEAAIAQYRTAERTAKARLDAQRALLRARQLRVAQTAVLAPDDGIISSRSATVGAVLPAGQELFRMIRKGRLEWRAEVPSADLALIEPGMTARIDAAGREPIAGTVRMVAPTVDRQTRNAIVYVDLPKPGAARAGMFASGSFDTGSSSALTLPQSAVLLRDGFAYVFVVGDDNKVREVKVGVGRRAEGRIEISGGVDGAARVVAAGGGFLGEGDTVRVVEATAAAASASAGGSSAGGLPVGAAPGSIPRAVPGSAAVADPGATASADVGSTSAAAPASGAARATASR